MAYLKTIPIHDEAGIDYAEKYIEDPEKTLEQEEPDAEDKTQKGVSHKDEGRTMSVRADDIQNVLEYDTDKNKTVMANGKRLVSGVLCNPSLEDGTRGCEEFAGPRDRYNSRGKRIYKDKRKQDVDAYHIIQSMSADVKDPELVHQIGLEFVEKLNATGLGEFQAVVSTHMNTIHLHNHILINAYSMDGRRKLGVNIALREQMRRISDEICLEHGLPIIDENFQHIEGQRIETIGEKIARQEGKSWKAEICEDIDAVVDTADTYEDWKKQMELLGYEIRERNDGTPVSISEGTHHCRFDKLGNGYSYEDIIEKIARANNMSVEQLKPKPKKVPKVYLTRVSRYDENGHRRNALTMLILKIINYFKNLAKLFIALGREAEAEEMAKKAYGMDKALKIAKEHNIVNKSEVKAAKKESGRKQRGYKDVIATAEKTIETINKIKNGEMKELPTAHKPNRIVRERDEEGNLQTKIDVEGLLEDDIDVLQKLEDELIALYQQRFKERGSSSTDKAIKGKLAEIKTAIKEAERKADELYRAEHPDDIPIPSSMAEIDPMSPGQKRDFFAALQNDVKLDENGNKVGGYRCYAKFTEISSAEADEIIAFLNLPEEDRNNLPLPDALTKKHKVKAPTPELLDAALVHAQKLASKAKKDLDLENDIYKDLMFLDKAIMDAEDIEAEVKSQEEQEREEERKKKEKGTPITPEDTIEPTGKEAWEAVKDAERIHRVRRDGKVRTWIDTSGLLTEDIQILKDHEATLVELYKIRSQSQHPEAIEQRIINERLVINAAIAKAEAKAQRAHPKTEREQNPDKKKDTSHTEI